MYVASNHINKGIGRKMIQRIEREAKKLGMKELKLKSALTAYGFYRKMGYKKTRKGKHRIGKSYLDIYYMKKKL
ncbi:MAG TPA: GNAT family N-acetyltransferase [archaeon]|nr:GNAT family N-acetyltransferase [archaeon]